MAFSTYTFLFLFLPAVLVIHRLAARYSVQMGRLAITGASILFFIFGGWKGLPILLLSLGVNFFIGQKLQDDGTPKAKKSLFLLGLAFNIGLLIAFKYWPLQHWVFPLALSFYTLSQITYLLDLYEGLLQQRSWRDYLYFVLFFPKLIAGPIAHFHEVLPEEDREGKESATAEALFLFVIGLSKKVLIADTLGSWVDPVFADPQNPHFFLAWGTSLSYTLQIYFDFSGYSDMALALGMLFGARLPINFNSPFRARNLVEFWSRWHISLTNFIMSYIFTPLFRSMPALTFWYSLPAVFLTMFIAGVWHGRGITFALYGALHGLGLCAVHLLKRYKIKLPLSLARLSTFVFVNFSFIVFRADSLEVAAGIWKGMLGLNSFLLPKGLLPKWMTTPISDHLIPNMNNDNNLQLAVILIGLFLVSLPKNSNQMREEFKPSARWVTLLALLFAFCLFGMNRVTQFIYVQF